MKGVKQEKEIEYCTMTGKRCYSEREANVMLNNAKNGVWIRKNGRNIKVRSKSKQIPKRKYFCEYCGTYHLTHLPYWKEKKEYE